jgi:predicted lipoprotein with Yx(FWY)xxD motif
VSRSQAANRAGPQRISVEEPASWRRLECKRPDDLEVKFVRRILILLAGAAATLSMAGLATAGFATASGRRATLELRKTGLGKILVNGRGLTLYMFVADRPNTDNCVKIVHCTTVWPLLTTTGKPITKSGVKGSLVGTIKLPNGQTQVTYAGHPVYTYIADTRPGQTFGEGVFQSGAKWYVLNGTGHVVK